MTTRGLALRWTWLAAALLGNPLHAWPARPVPVTVVVDFTAEGRKVAHPTPDHPAYYFPIAGNFQELGAVSAGEQAPVQKDVLHSVALALAEQGYRVMHPAPRVNAHDEIIYADGTVVMVPPNPRRPGAGRRSAGLEVPLTVAMLDAPAGPYSLAAAKNQPANGPEGPPPIYRVLRSVDPRHGGVLDRMPSLILTVNYGTLNPQITQLGEGQQIFFNENTMLGLVGGNTLKNITLDFQREEIRQAAGEDRYFILVSAYDFKAYAATRKKVLLWQAKISTPSHGIEKFSDVDAALVQAGATAFGRETPRPVVMTFQQTPAGKVEVGPLTVQGVSDPAASAPSAGASGAKINLGSR